MELFELWGAWLGGETVGDLELWGTTVTGWGRVGKIAQFAAALFVLAEIAGPARVRRLGESLRFVSSPIAVLNPIGAFPFLAIARLLEHPRSDTLLKIVAVVLLALGFHFDLLAS